MNLIEKIYYKVILEQQLPKGKKSNQLVKAITDRNPITFYYSGPREGKDSVKPGVRLRAEAVAMGLSKGGNVIIRAFVQPPSVSKKGYGQTGWRTFRIDRMSNIQVLDETFDQKRPGYKEGSESEQGPMIKTYVTTDWSKKPEPKKVEVEPTTTKPQPKPEKPEVTPTEPSLPQPKKDEKPSPIPQDQSKDFSFDVFKTIQPKEVDGLKVITTQDFENAVQKIYSLKQSEWANQQKQLNKNTSPGEGTRKRFEISSKSELSNLLNKNGIVVSDQQPEPETEDQSQLAESIKRIKTLMLH